MGYWLGLEELGWWQLINSCFVPDALLGFFDIPMHGLGYLYRKSFFPSKRLLVLRPNSQEHDCLIFDIFLLFFNRIPSGVHRSPVRPRAVLQYLGMVMHPLGGFTYSGWYYILVVVLHPEGDFTPSGWFYTLRVVLHPEGVFTPWWWSYIPRVVLHPWNWCVH